tara:strand:- start:108 stop:356 length:249 start_codon:yes stop_codon:yes gene_type:complete
MYYVDYLAMIASCLKPSLNSTIGLNRLRKDKRLSVQKKNPSLSKYLLASICLLLLIALVPENPTNVASLCEKYNSSVACQVW